MHSGPLGPSFLFCFCLVCRVCCVLYKKKKKKNTNTKTPMTMPMHRSTAYTTNLVNNRAHIMKIHKTWICATATRQTGQMPLPPSPMPPPNMVFVFVPSLSLAFRCVVSSQLLATPSRSRFVVCFFSRSLLFVLWFSSLCDAAIYIFCLCVCVCRVHAATHTIKPHELSSPLQCTMTWFGSLCRCCFGSPDIYPLPYYWTEAEYSILHRDTGKL